MLGDACVHCHAEHSEENPLQFDHIDPLTKNFDIPSGWSKAHDTFFDEVEKCQLLCREAHDEKTSKERRIGVLAMQRERSRLNAMREAEGKVPF